MEGHVRAFLAGGGDDQLHAVDALDGKGVLDGGPFQRGNFLGVLAPRGGGIVPELARHDKFVGRSVVPVQQLRQCTES